MAQRPYHRQNLAAAIQQRARQELESQGAAQLSLRQLAGFLDVTPAAIYRHFPDKASLLAGLRAELTDELTTVIHQGVLETPVAQEMLAKMVNNLWGYAHEHPHAIQFLLTAPVPAPQSLTTVLALLGNQASLNRPAAELTAPVWTFLIGALNQGEDQYTEDWIVHQLGYLMGLPTSGQ